ncbi:hypothetical protein F511_20396, partial [Dorcoceras hygrometricum]
QALSVIPRGSWGDVARRSYHDPLGKSGIVIPEPQCCSSAASPGGVIRIRRGSPTALSMIPRGSWGDVARRSYHDPMGKSGIMIPEPQWLWAHG